MGLRIMNRASARSLFIAANAGSKSSRFRNFCGLELHAQGLSGNLGLFSRLWTQDDLESKGRRRGIAAESPP